MPCVSYPNSPSPENKKISDLIDRIEKLNVMLCSACRVLKRMDYDFEENPMLSIWWKNHQVVDHLKIKSEDVRGGLACVKCGEVICDC